MIATGALTKMCEATQRLGVQLPRARCKKIGMILRAEGGELHARVGQQRLGCSRLLDTISAHSCRLDVAELVLYLISRHLIEDHQQAAHQLIWIMAYRNDDASVDLSGGEVGVRKRLKIRKIMRDKRFMLASRI